MPSFMHTKIYLGGSKAVLPKYIVYLNSIGLHKGKLICFNQISSLILDVFLQACLDNTSIIVRLTYIKRMLYLGSLRETLGKAFLLSFVCILYVLKAIRLILFIYFHK